MVTRQTIVVDAFFAEPRIVLENSNPLTVDGVAMCGGTSEDCIVEFPKARMIIK